MGPIACRPEWPRNTRGGLSTISRWYFRAPSERRLLSLSNPELRYACTGLKIPGPLGRKAPLLKGRNTFETGCHKNRIGTSSHFHSFERGGRPVLLGKSSSLRIRVSNCPVYCTAIHDIPRRAKGPVNPSPGQRPGSAPPSGPRAESPFHAAGPSITFTPIYLRTPERAALAGMQKHTRFHPP
jgi:hypothetical protein